MSAGVRFLEGNAMGTRAAAAGSPTQPRVLSIDNSPRFAANSMEIDDLYREPLGIRPILGHALRGLAAGKEAVQESLEALKRGELIRSDESMQRVQALMPELFC